MPESGKLCDLYIYLEMRMFPSKNKMQKKNVAFRKKLVYMSA